MNSSIVTPQNSSLIILGASEYPEALEFDSSKSFEHAANSIRKFFLSKEGMELSADSILDLFNSDKSASEHGLLLSEFIERQADSEFVFIYYVGHGSFLSNNQYILPIRSTISRHQNTTAILTSNLSMLLDEFAGDKKIFIILDCCFSGEAIKSFQGSVSPLIDRSIKTNYTGSGVTILVSSSKNDPSLNPKNLEGTMFTDSFIELLSAGIPSSSDLISMSDLGSGLIKLTP